jgi:protein-S-isoprenylcysteine O-methyltransferase Ste14
MSDDTHHNRAEGRLTEWLLRAFAVLIYVFAVSNLGSAWWSDPARWTLLLLLVTEGYTLLMVLLARKATRRDVTPLVVLATGYAAFFFVLLEAEGTRAFVPEEVGVALQLIGLGWQFASKMTLGRSFGLLPAQRGLVLSGPYRLVRHPIYLGYLITHIGFLLVNASWTNLGVLVLLYGVQWYRIEREESVLAQSPEYREYQQRVRWRLVPGLY